MVYKTIDGSNGKGVVLVKDRQELLNIVKQSEKISFPDQLDLLIRKYLRKKK
ncbi:MAG: hypothetical protein J7K89_04935, partial [Candidatus Cloacimonetes bacterium]|nr:hypothetical protein [Candidatus Cloacimonadota bacterium]